MNGTFMFGQDRFGPGEDSAIPADGYGLQPCATCEQGRALRGRRRAIR
jgi:hypothetical protein